ncbi:hypothetical protein LUR56_38105, partial [Streptomyces sp. MT29]|nr:hypothetical protein [Streptomyces sp. MT29]
MTEETQLGPGRQLLSQELRELLEASKLTQAEAIRRANRRSSEYVQLKPATVNDWFTKGTPADSFKQLWALVEVLLIACGDRDPATFPDKNEIKNPADAVATSTAKAKWRVSRAYWNILWDKGRSDPTPTPVPRSHLESPAQYQIGPYPRRGAESPAEPLHEQPSQLLLARHQVVPFIGRRDELKRLAAWRDDPAGPTAAVQLLHGSGGQGKTRLGAKFAADTPADWRVWQASRSASSVMVPAERKASSLGPRALIVVDYAERWPAKVLIDFMRDMAGRRGAKRLRVLLIARSAGSWWQNLLHDLRDLRYAASAVELKPLENGLAGDRSKAFLAARDGFAHALRIASDATAVEVPANIDHPAFGLILTVHMAALGSVFGRDQGAVLVRSLI